MHFDFTVSDNDFISSQHSIKCVPMVCKIPPLLELSARAIVHNNPHDKLEDLPQSLQGDNLIKSYRFLICGVFFSNE